MWIVRLALRRPYTFVVAALLVAILGGVTLLRMPTDMFPSIDIPVVSVIFSYRGISAEDMERRIVTPFERSVTTTVSEIDRIESQSLNGIAVIKVFFQPGAKIEAAVAQITAVAQSAIRNMPPGTQPPLIIRYNAGNVPILQLSLSSKTMPEQQLFDYAVNFIRPQLVTIPGVQIPYPYGGKQRQIMVDLDPERLHAWGISPGDVSAAINAQNLILPAGSTKIGTQEYQVRLNSSPETVEALNDLPIKTVNGTTVFIRDVASVRDGSTVQTNVVHSDGVRGALMSIYKSSDASTLTVVNAIMEALPRIQATVPPDLRITPSFDQSLFVRAAVEGVIKEAALAAGLTGLMILLFLGSWRSTLVVVISIPLSILVSIITLYALGQTLNVMTLGGLALAVGILVDDATVEIENIHRNLHQGKRLVRAILDGAHQILVPAFVSMLCICIVFVPVVFIGGVAKYLFTPLAMAVVFAMVTSYLLSRTLVPTMVRYLLATEVERYGGQPDPLDLDDSLGTGGSRWLSQRGRLALMVAAALAAALVFALLHVPHDPASGFWGRAREIGGAVIAYRRTLGGWLLVIVGGAGLLWGIDRYDLIWRVHAAFDRRFEQFRRFYGGLLAWALSHRPTVVIGFLTLVAGSCGLLLGRIGTDFFPSVDAGQIRLHVRCPAGTRLEETTRYVARVTDAIREIIPPQEIATILDNIGIPYSGINLSMSDGTMISPADGEIFISLTEEHGPTEEYVRRLRAELPRRFPNVTFFFSAPDIATQVLNFGLSAPIDVQVSGPIQNAEANRRLAGRLRDELARIPGAVDVRLQQVAQTPDLRVSVDRVMASQLGLTQRDVASSLLISLSSSMQTAPNFWLNPANGVNYNVVVQTPQYAIRSLNDLQNTPVIPEGTANRSESTQILGNLAEVSRGVSATNVTHASIMPCFNVLMDVQDADLGSVSRAVREVIDRFQDQLPRGTRITVRGQAESMRTSFSGLGYGLLFAVVLVYLIMVINFQSWLDPLIILMALPGAAAGILWMLWATDTNICVPALMGAMMSIGVATANSVLMITFANDQRKVGHNARDAALLAGLTRLRPVIMTALAMIIGMLPMSLGLGEGGEQNAPLGRAVIGGLILATFATLIFVPVVYSLLRTRPPRTHIEEELR
ncbi:MAG TPA: efflux RND transporter permease subunit [Phycisphaerae bacterium]|nr:efflux RND transporter permease subunit [Phycisphaerae bacterium]